MSLLHDSTFVARAFHTLILLREILNTLLLIHDKICVCKYDLKKWIAKRAIHRDVCGTVQGKHDTYAVIKMCILLFQSTVDITLNLRIFFITQNDRHKFILCRNTFQKLCEFLFV
jgi:hypothetical protein